MKPSAAWFDVLKKLTPKALESGVERLKALSNGDKFVDYPPNCLQFKALCLAFYEDLRLPSTSDAYREVRALAYTDVLGWSHPVVKFTASKLNLDFFKLADLKAYEIFKIAYEQVCLLVKQGHELPPLPNQPMIIRSQTRAIAEAELTKIKRLLGV